MTKTPESTPIPKLKMQTANTHARNQDQLNFHQYPESHSYL